MDDNFGYREDGEKGNEQGSPQVAYAQPPVTQAASAQPAPVSGLAIAGLVLGILAILGAFVPLLNLGAVPFAIVGLVLAAVGYSGIKKGKHSGRGIALAGIVLGIVSLVVIIGMYGCAGAVSSASGSGSSAASSAASATVSAKPSAASASAGSAVSSQAAAEGSAAPAAAQASSAAASEPEPAAVSPDLKDALDSYEAFIDEYIAFMQKYSESGNAASLMTDYLNYMQKYSDLTAKLESLDAASFSAADSAYYTEVMTRVSEKLLSVSL